jgi:GT2 family glycosyltransferase
VRASIILVSYNGVDYLRSCIDSIHQEITLEDEIIVVDNASNDGSADLVEQRWPEVRLFRNIENAGFAGACNQGADYAKGDTLVFLNQDTRVQPGWLRGLLAALEHDPTVGLVTSKLLLMSHPGQIQMCGQDIHFTGFSFGRGLLSASDGYGRLEKVGAVSGASFAIRRNLWEQLGGFDPCLFMYYEETDLCWRAKLAGFSSLYCPDSVAYHDYSVTSSPIAHSYSERNRLVLLLKNWKSLTLLLLMPSLLLAEIIDWGYMLSVGWKGIRAKVSSWMWLLRNFSTVLRSRKIVQASRKEPDWTLLKTCITRLKPRVYTGGWIGKGIIYVCNLWFGLHYKLVFSLLYRLNI